MRDNTSGFIGLTCLSLSDHLFSEFDIFVLLNTFWDRIIYLECCKTVEVLYLPGRYFWDVLDFKIIFHTSNYWYIVTGEGS